MLIFTCHFLHNTSDMQFFTFNISLLIFYSWLIFLDILLSTSHSQYVTLDTSFSINLSQHVILEMSLLRCDSWHLTSTYQFRHVILLMSLHVALDISLSIFHCWHVTLHMSILIYQSYLSLNLGSKMVILSQPNNNRNPNN